MIIVDSDTPRIVGTNVDFGSLVLDPIALLDGIFQPASPGTLDWESEDGVITPHLKGWMYTKDLAGTAAKMRMTYYAEGDNGDYVHLATRGSDQHLPDNDDFELTEIDMAPYGDPAVVRVVVATTVKNANGHFIVNDSQTFNLN
ncbi:MAG TPA: hypothetical protein VKB57_24590 [Acidimicrobiales bacterium]|nr:hypothetical protein [Acidimicrobiales bacterium]